MGRWKLKSKFNLQVEAVFLNGGGVECKYLPENVPEYMPPPRSLTVSITAPPQSVVSGDEAS